TRSLHGRLRRPKLCDPVSGALHKTLSHCRLTDGKSLTDGVADIASARPSPTLANGRTRPVVRHVVVLAQRDDVEEASALRTDGCIARGKAGVSIRDPGAWRTLPR